MKAKKRAATTSSSTHKKHKVGLAKKLKVDDEKTITSDKKCESNDAKKIKFPELMEEDLAEANLDQMKEGALLTVDDSVYLSAYKTHVEHELTQDQLTQLQSKYTNTAVISWETLHRVVLLNRSNNSEVEKRNELQSVANLVDNPGDISALHSNCGVHKALATNWFKDKSENAFTNRQNEVFSLLLQYKSLYYPCCITVEDEAELRDVYCLHALNHVVKARAKVSKNNRQLSKLSTEKRDAAECRDQGFTRPKVLILAPFRESCRKIVNIFVDLLKTDKKFEISNWKRFQKEFNVLYDDEEEKDAAIQDLRKKPQDYQRVFSGNTDEHYRVGISLLNSAFRLYAPFYSSDIIIASPLGLRTVIGEKGEPHYQYDFLSSIEMCILDSADIFLMQNWEHVIHIMKHLHLQPLEAHDVDFSRVRNSVLEGHVKHYCQTLLFSSVSLPSLSSLMTKYCFNYHGLAIIQSVLEKGSICGITKPVPQIYHKLNVTSQPYSEVLHVRFEFFVNQILKQIKEKKLRNVLVYLPQYFDYVRIRNYLRREAKSLSSSASYACICEYMKPQAVKKAKKKFLSGEADLLLYTERYHFYNRPKLRGFENLLFYELPSFPMFYTELCNAVKTQESDIHSSSAITLYSKYDCAKLVTVLGNKRTEVLMSSQKKVHMFFTENNS